MAVVIRLARRGKKKNPYYHINVADSRNPRDGKFLETVGAYDPNVKPPKVEFSEERVQHWVKTGAVMSDTVRDIVRRFRKAAAAKA
jgi:small subunit ribosomal protein S16